MQHICKVTVTVTSVENVTVFTFSEAEVFAPTNHYLEWPHSAKDFKPGVDHKTANFNLFTLTLLHCPFP